MLEPFASEITTFVNALFRYADDGTFVSLRSFYEAPHRNLFLTASVELSRDRSSLIAAAINLAGRCAVQNEPVVFCPPVATFSNGRGAREDDLANGLTLTAECDSAPAAARQKLEQLLGPATVVVASGGEWIDPGTGEIHDKLHLHWRLSEVTRDANAHAALKLARSLVCTLVRADSTNKPIVHPIRWPGSWHRKGEPRPVRMVALNENAEIHLEEALEWLQEATATLPPRGNSATHVAIGNNIAGEGRSTAELVRDILTAADYHAPIVALAMRYLKGEMSDPHVVLTLRGLMLAVPEAVRDLKDGALQPGRWQARFDDIPRAVSTAREKLGAAAGTQGAVEALSAIDPASFRLDRMTRGLPPPQLFLLRCLMPLGKVGLIFGPGGVGKSLVALDLCLAVADRHRSPVDSNRGLEPLGYNVPQEAAGASIFVTTEDDAADVHRRIHALDPERRRDGLPCFVIPTLELPDFEPALVQMDGRLAALTEFARSGLDLLLVNVAREAGCPVRLVVLDPAGDFIEAEENAAETVKPLMRQLRALARKHGCTIILVGHVAKSASGDVPSMRGSSAWVANSRFAYALWWPTPDEAKQSARKLNCNPEALVYGSLVKANHAGAPVGIRRVLYREAATGRLHNTTDAMTQGQGESEAELLDMLVKACSEYAAAGLPFSMTGVAGLYAGRTDLPPALAGLSRRRLDELGNAALDSGRLEKARTKHSQGAPKYLDVPNGPLARGAHVEMSYGSRREALAQRRNAPKTVDAVPQDAVPEPNDVHSAFPVPAFPLVTSQGGNGSNPQKSAGKSDSQLARSRSGGNANRPRKTATFPHSQKTPLKGMTGSREPVVPKA